jgi:hypothetical protein
MNSFKNNEKKKILLRIKKKIFKKKKFIENKYLKKKFFRKKNQKII